MTAPARESSTQDERRIASRVHPLGAALPVLEWQPSFHVRGFPRTEIRTIRLGVTTEWLPDPPPVAQDDLLNLYSWSERDALKLGRQTFAPGVRGYWNDQQRLSRGGKPWAVTIRAVATEHVGRFLHLPPALMVRLYNGSLHFALPREVEL